MNFADFGRIIAHLYKRIAHLKNINHEEILFPQLEVKNGKFYRFWQILLIFIQKIMYLRNKIVHLKNISHEESSYFDN